MAGLERRSECRLRLLCSKSPGSVCAELSFIKTEKKAHGEEREAGDQRETATAQSGDDGSQSWGGASLRRRGHPKETLLIGLGSSEWEEPCLRD